MQPLADFDLERPTNVADAVALLAHAASAMAVAGGTDLLPRLGRGLHGPALLVDLGAIDGFGAVERRATHWRLGAGATLAAIAGDAPIAAELPALAQAAAAVAGPGHRSAATLGGNLCQDTRCVFYNQSAWWRQANDHCLKRGGSVCHVAPQGDRCHAAFAGDLAPALIAYDAEVELAGPQGTRRLPLDALYRDDGAAHLTLGRGELVVALHLPRPAPGSASGYRKHSLRGAIDFPLAAVAIALTLQDGSIASLAVGLSGTNPQPLRLAGTQDFVGRRVDDTLLAAIGKLVQKQVSPMRSTMTPSNHRRQAASVLTQRLLRELATR